MVTGMEERYWLRHASLDGQQGPLEEKDLRSAIDANAFPRNSEVLLDTGLPEERRAKSNDWISVTQLLGLEPPPAQPSVWPQAGVRSTPERRLGSDRLTELRHGSAYPNTRMLIASGIVIAVIAELLVMFMQMSASRGSGSTGIPLFTSVIAVITTIAIGNVLLAVLDMADVAVRKLPDPNGE